MRNSCRQQYGCCNAYKFEVWLPTFDAAKHTIIKSDTARQNQRKQKDGKQRVYLKRFLVFIPFASEVSHEVCEGKQYK